MGFARWVKYFFTHLFTYYQYSHSIQAGSWAKQSTNVLTCSDAQLWGYAYRNKWFSKLFPAWLRGGSHIPHTAQWGTRTTSCGRRDTFVPCLGKQESWIVPLQTCVPCKSKRMIPKPAQSTTHCSSQSLSVFCIPPCHWTPASACPQPTHIVFP